MNLKIIIYAFILVFSFFKNVKAQHEINVTEYMLYQPLINTASIASYNSFSGVLLYRKQWVGLEGAPETAITSFNSPIGQTNLFTGGNVEIEKIGANSNLNLLINFAYKFKISRNIDLSLALNGGINYSQSNYSNLFFNDIGDPEFGTNGTNNLLLPKSGFSSYLFSSKFYFGLIVPNFFKHYNSINNPSILDYNSLHVYSTLGYGFVLSQNFDLNISTLIKGTSGAPVQYDFNAQLMYSKKIGLGINYRSSFDFSIISTFYINNSIGISYAYDYGFADISSYHRNTHEISLLFDIPYKDLLKVSTPRF